MQDSERAQEAKCGLCGEPMPEGEEMFKFHGYSGGCPKPPLAEVAKYLGSMLAVDPPPSGASSQAETVAKLLLAARQVASFARAWEPLSPGDIRDLTKAIEAMDALPAPVSPVEPEPPTNPPCVRCGHALSAHRPEFGACDGRDRPCACPEYQVPTAVEAERAKACHLCGAPMKVEREP